MQNTMNCYDGAPCRYEGLLDDASAELVALRAALAQAQAERDAATRRAEQAEAVAARAGEFAEKRILEHDFTGGCICAGCNAARRILAIVAPPYSASDDLYPSAERTDGDVKGGV